jgi:lysozyme family protein
MARDRFSDCLAVIFDEEGGFSDMPGDPGGATNLGITRATLARWRGHAVSRDDVISLERDEAAAIYRKTYWDAIGGGDLPAGLDLALFDDAVNSGPAQAVRDLQRALDVPADGLIGPVTEAAIAARPLADVVSALCAARRTRLKALPQFSQFGRGWTRRIQRIERLARPIAKAASAPGRSNVAAKPAAPTKGSSMNTTATPDTKPFWASQTIWSSIAVIGSSAAGGLIAWKSNDIAGFGAALTALLGGLNAIVGRVRSTQPIG